MNIVDLVHIKKISEGIINSPDHHISIFVSAKKLLSNNSFKNIKIHIEDVKNRKVYENSFENNMIESPPRMRININKDCICEGPFKIRIVDSNEDLIISFEIGWVSILA